MGDTFIGIGMEGTIVEWDERFGSGVIWADTGERVRVPLMALRDYQRGPKVGDRIHFWAEEIVTVTYTLREVRAIEVEAVTGAELAKLQRACREEERAEAFERRGIAVQSLRGTITTFNARTHSGVVELEDGSQIEISRSTWVDKRKIKYLQPGASVSVSIFFYRGENGGSPEHFASEIELN